MEFLGEDQSVNSRALQVHCERLHFSSRVRQMRIANSRHNQAPALNADFQSAKNLRRNPERIICAVQAVEPARMILFVQTFRPQEQMQVSHTAVEFSTSLICGGSRCPESWLRKRSWSWARSRTRGRCRRCSA